MATNDSEPNVGSPVGESRFAAQARQRDRGLGAEFLAFLRATRKWWLAPIIILLLLVGLLVVLGGSAAAPFIYTLF
jgi:hypothetical protein